MFALCVLNRQIVSYKELVTKFPDIKSAVHDYGFMRYRHHEAFRALCADFGVDDLQDEITIEQSVFTRFGGLCVQNIKKRENQLATIARLYFNAYFTYHAVDHKFWKMYEVDESQAVEEQGEGDREEYDSDYNILYSRDSSLKTE